MQSSFFCQKEKKLLDPLPRIRSQTPTSANVPCDTCHFLYVWKECVFVALFSCFEHTDDFLLPMPGGRGLSSNVVPAYKEVKQGTTCMFIQQGCSGSFRHFHMRGIVL